MPPAKNASDYEEIQQSVWPGPSSFSFTRSNTSSEKSRKLAAALKTRVATLSNKHEGMVRTLPPPTRQDNSWTSSFSWLLGESPETAADGTPAYTYKELQQHNRDLKHQCEKLSSGRLSGDFWLRLEQAEEAQKTTQEAMTACESRLGTCEDLQAQIAELTAELESQKRQSRNVQRSVKVLPAPPEAEHPKILQLQEQHKETQKTMSAQYDSLAQQLSNLAAEHEKLKKHARGLEMNMSAQDSYQSLHPEAAQRLHSAEQGRRDLEARLGDLESGKQTLGKTRVDEQRRLQVAEARVRELEDEVSSGAKEKVRAQDLEAEGEQLRAEIAHLRASRAQEVEHWKAQMEIQMDKAARAEAANQASHTQTMDNRIDSLMERVDMDREIDLLREQHAEYTSRLSGDLSAKDAELERMRESMSRLNAEISMHQQAHNEAGERHAAEIATFRSRDIHHQQVLSDLEAYKAAAAEVEMHRAREAEYQLALEDLEVYKERAAAGDRALAELEQLQRNGGDQSEVEMLRSRLIEAQGAQRQVEALRNQNEMLNTQFAAIARDKDQELEFRQQTAEHHQRQHEELQVQYRDLQLQHQELMAGPQGGPSQEEYDELSMQYEQVVGQIEQMGDVQAAWQQAQEDNQALQSEVQALQHELHDARANSADVNLAQELEAETLQLRGRVQELEGEIQQGLSRTQELEGENLKLRSTIHAMEARAQGGVPMVTDGTGSLKTTSGVLQSRGMLPAQQLPPSPVRQPAQGAVRLSQNQASPQKPLGSLHRLPPPTTAPTHRPLIVSYNQPLRGTSPSLNKPVLQTIPTQRPEWRS